MSFFQEARSTNASHSHFTSVGESQHNLNIVQVSPTKDSTEPDLADLSPVRRSYYKPPCSPGTRQWIVEEIHRWFDDEEAPNILLLSGSPGVGKSTIASTVVSNLAEMGRLGSQFFFERGDVTLSEPTTVWRTVAFDLARMNSRIARKVKENLKAGKVDPLRVDIAMHFKYLVEDPLTEVLKRSGELEEVRDDPLDLFRRPDNSPEKIGMQYPVVVFDALDECGSDGSQIAGRRIFVDTIMKWSRLDRKFKLLITSRDDRITPALRAACHHITLETGDLVSPEAGLDVETFFENRFANITSSYLSLQPSWPGKSIIKQLTRQAAGLFIWADTIMQYLEQGPPEEQLAHILCGTFREEGGGIDKLYQQILHLLFKNSRASVLVTFKRVVGIIVLAKIPLCRDDIYHFLEGLEEKSSIDFILEKLSSVISTRNSDNRVHVSHLSFTEFICDRTRGDMSFIIDDGIHSLLALSCFHTMNTGLQFNICRIETSHIEDREQVIKFEDHIPSHLSYSCLFGAEHLQATVSDMEILQEEVKNFLYIHFLHWLEVLSVMKKVSIAPWALKLIGQWFRVCYSSLFWLRFDIYLVFRHTMT
jgi:hypothetical protein